MATGPNDALWKETREAFATADFESLAELVMRRGDPGLRQEYPQSGEAFRGRDRIVEMNQSYPTATGTKPTFAPREIRTGGDLAVVEGTIDYGNGSVASYVGIIEAKDGRVTRMTEYFGDPFPAPDWRKPYAESA